MYSFCVFHYESFEDLFDSVSGTIFSVDDIEYHRRNRPEDTNGVSKWFDDIPTEPVDKEDHIPEGDDVSDHSRCNDFLQ